VPVSFVPFIIPLLLIGIPSFCAIKGSKEAAITALTILIILAAMLFLVPFMLVLIAPLLVIGIPVLIAIVSRKRAARIAAWVSIGFVVLLFLWVYVPGWLLMAKAYDGDAKSQYKLAKWTEGHSEAIGAVILWPVQPDVLGGDAWLEKAAQQNYPPALYAVGVRLKRGYHGPGGNVVPQTERGQSYIDKAIALGYKP
jgi:hypothetical protein